MPERDHDPIRQRNADRGDAMQEPEGADQEKANALDLTAVEAHDAEATPTGPEIEKAAPVDAAPDKSVIGSPAADPQRVR